MTDTESWMCYKIIQSQPVRTCWCSGLILHQCQISRLFCPGETQMETNQLSGLRSTMNECTDATWRTPSTMRKTARLWSQSLRLPITTGTSWCVMSWTLSMLSLQHLTPCFETGTSYTVFCFIIFEPWWRSPSSLCLGLSWPLCSVSAQQPLVHPWLVSMLFLICPFSRSLLGSKPVPFSLSYTVQLGYEIMALVELIWQGINSLVHLHISQHPRYYMINWQISFHIR